MIEAVREMTFEEEYEILQRESKEVFAKEDTSCEPIIESALLRRALRCIDKLMKTSRREWYQKGYQDGLNADKWIPCEERPKEMCRCLVTTKEGLVTETIYDKPFDRFVLQEDSLAWQPLPEPYKKEGNSNENT